MDNPNNYHAVGDFVNEWGEAVRDRNNSIIFECSIKYRSCFGEQEFKTKAMFQLDGYNPTIILDEAKKFKAEKYHLNFVIELVNDIQFDKTTKALIILGQSPKMGKYRVEILPQED